MSSVQVPLAERLPKPQDVVASAYDFAEKLLSGQRQFAEDLVKVTAPLRAGGAADFLAGFAFTLPVIVIGDYLGVPEEGRDNLRQWAEDLGSVIFVSGNDEDRMRKGEDAMGRLADFLRPVIRDRRAEPRDDLLSGMVRAEERGDFLSEDELIANAILMVFAGHETTMNLLANGIVAFSRFPGQWARLRGDPSLAATATEEILRYDGPIRAMARWAREPVRIGGRDIAAGEILTFDYLYTESAIFEPFDCGCGAPDCRGRIERVNPVRHSA